MRKVLKKAIERAAIVSGLPHLRRKLEKPRAVILGYHNVVPEGARPVGDGSLHLPVDRFRSQLDLLGEYFEVVPLESLFGSGPSPTRPVAVLTFDDAYRGALEVGIPEVLSRGYSATVFVPPGLLGVEGFWWDLLSDADSGSVSPDARHHALSRLGGRQEEVLRWAASRGLVQGPLPELYRPAGEAEVLEASQSPGVALASHTWSHVSLVSVGRAEAEEELSRAIRWLDEAGGSTRVISYPYGAWDPRLESLAKAAGHRMGLLIRGGGFSASSLPAEPFAVPRINVPSGLSLDGFLLRVSGVWPS